ncbi:MAG TPA: LytTR family DNA-binding domain-containing protein [Puia sp.]|jgi:DNA-binding LytR/AlgR family response regulator
MQGVLKYLIVEDDEIDRLSVETAAENFSFLKRIASCSHPLDAVELIRACQPDVLFLDIEMPGINGLQLARQLKNPQLLLVFITSHAEFAVDGYELEAFDYLLKPFTPERFSRLALRLRDFSLLRQKAFAFEREQEAETLVIKQGYEKHKIQLKEILYLEAMKDYTRIIVPGKQFLVLATLSSMQEQLPAGRFIRIHRSYVVNPDKIIGTGGNKVSLPGCELPVGKIYKHAISGIL